MCGSECGYSEYGYVGEWVVVMADASGVRGEHGSSEWGGKVRGNMSPRSN